MESLNNPMERPAPAWAGEKRLPVGRQARAVALGHAPDRGWMVSVAKAMALANARLGGIENALRFPAHRNQGAAGLSPHSQ